MNIARKVNDTTEYFRTLHDMKDSKDSLYYNDSYVKLIMRRIELIHDRNCYNYSAELLRHSVY